MPVKKETPAANAMEPTPGSAVTLADTPPEVNVPVSFESDSIPAFEGDAAEFTSARNCTISLRAHKVDTGGIASRSHFQIAAGETRIIPKAKAQTLIDRGWGTAVACDNPSDPKPAPKPAAAADK